MIEPTDAEIIALADETRTAEGGANGYILPISFASAVLAKWGTPSGAVPLTPEAINVMAREYPAEDLCGWSYRMGVADAEAHHGIKGDEHDEQ